MVPLTPLGIFYATVVFVPLVVNLLAGRDRKLHDAVSVSLMILTIWGCTRTAHALWSEIGDRVIVNVLLDTIAGLSLLRLWVRTGANWAIVLAWLYAAQVGLGTRFLWGWYVLGRDVPPHDYLAANNVIWLVALFCATTPGGGRVAGRFIDYLRRPARGSNHLGLPT